VGFPRWNVELLKVRNGNPGAWKIEWSAGSFRPVINKQTIELQREHVRKAG